MQRALVAISLGALAVMALSSCGRAAPPPPVGAGGSTPALEANATVVEVVVGDTVVARVSGHDEHVRLLGFVSPT